VRGIVELVLCSAERHIDSSNVDRFVVQTEERKRKTRRVDGVGVKGVRLDVVVVNALGRGHVADFACIADEFPAQERIGRLI